MFAVTNELFSVSGLHLLDLNDLCSVSWQNLEFHGVMRFYFEDHVGGNVATKCLRVCSSSSTHELIETLSEKFRPDIKMLTTSYSLYEIHASKGNERAHAVYQGAIFMYFF